MLEKKIGERPEKSELQERNILKGAFFLLPLSSTVIWIVGMVLMGGCGCGCVGVDDKVAPALQAAKERLERSQLEVCLCSLIASLIFCTGTYDGLVCIIRHDIDIG